MNPVGVAVPVVCDEHGVFVSTTSLVVSILEDRQNERHLREFLVLKQELVVFTKGQIFRGFKDIL